MRNMATCYSEGAIKVSDAGRRKRCVSSVPAFKKAVRCLYRVKLSSEEQFLIKITWCGVAAAPSAPARGFWISVCDYPCSSLNKNYSRQIEKPKGSVLIQGCSAKSEVFWDLSNASYAAGPEPVAGFCILVLINSEIVLFLGDNDQELASQKCRLKAAAFSLVSRCEYFSAAGGGGGSGAGFSTKARFCDSGDSHDIVIRCSGEEKGGRNWTLSVSIDERNVIVVPRLQWNFRGNQTIFVDGLVVDMMWDVHDWMFGRRSGGAVFMFRTRSGLDSRLWLAEKNLEQKEQENLGFCFLICACKNPS